MIAWAHRNKVQRRRTTLAATGCLMFAASSACVSSRAVLVGEVRPAISPDLVNLYLEPPASNYREIANLTASSRGSFALTALGKTDKVIERLKRQAARLGANGILLHGVGVHAAESVGAEISTSFPARI